VAHLHLAHPRRERLPRHEIFHQTEHCTEAHNPIELPYSKFKAYLRKLAARTVPSLHRAIRSFLHILKPRECAHYYKHAGYVPYDRYPL
jgi:hypothetical protein